MRLAATFGGRRALAWAPSLALVVVNVLWLFVFGSGSRIREADLGRRLERAQRERADAVGRLALREQLWIGATDNRERVERLDRELFASERARFTDTVRELKDLAGRAGLDPGSIGYPREDLAQYGLSRRSFVFAVHGSYGALRTFLNLVELTPSFLVVEQIDVDEAGGGLAIRLHLSTLFTTAPEAAATAPEAASTAPATAAGAPPAGTGGGG